MGNLKADAVYPGMDGSTMSIGYHYSLTPGGDYDWIVVYERSHLKATKAINARTFFNVHRRNLKSDAVLHKSIDELLAAAMEE